MTFASGLLGGYIYGLGRSPNTQILEWNTAEILTPAGTRANASGTPSFVKILGPTAGGAMEFDDMVLDFSAGLSANYTSKVQCLTLGLTDDDYTIGNIRYWQPSGTALGSTGHVEMIASGAWHYNATLPSGAGAVVSTSLPSARNVRRQDGGALMEFALDTHVSEFIYTALTIPSGFGLGSYGKGSNGDWVNRMTYDWYYKYSPTSTSGPSPIEVLTTTSGTTVGTVVDVPYMGDRKVGQLLVAVICYEDDSALTPPAGWTLKATSVQTAEVSIHLYYKVSDGTETGNASWTSGGAGLMYGIMTNFENATEIHLTADGQGAATTSITSPTMVTTKTGIIFHCASWERANATWPTTVDGALQTLINDAIVVAGNPTISVGYETQSTAGATNGRTFTSAAAHGAASLVWAVTK